MDNAGIIVVHWEYWENDGDNMKYFGENNWDNYKSGDQHIFQPWGYYW